MVIFHIQGSMFYNVRECLDVYFYYNVKIFIIRKQYMVYTFIF